MPQTEDTFGWSKAEEYLRNENQVRRESWGPAVQLRRMVQNTRLYSGPMQLQQHDGEGVWDYYVPTTEDKEAMDWCLV